MAEHIIAITGANGLLGQKLVQLLAHDMDTQVIATGRGPARITSPAGDRFTYQELDVCDEAAVRDFVSTHQPTTLIHTAAMTNVDQCESERAECRRLNVDATRYLAEACAAQATYLCHLSTDFIFDGAAGPYDEEAQPNPISFYGHSKADAERAVMETPGLAWGIGRTILVYGMTPGMSRSNIILWVKSSLEQGKKIQVVDDQWRTPTLAEDLATGCQAMARLRAPGIYNLAGPDLLTPYDMALATARYFGLDESLIERVDGSRFSQPARRPPRTGLVIEKARRVLAYEPASFAEGIQILAEQF